MEPGSFAFRLACYQEFGWKPADIPDIPLAEAVKLSIYFAETGKYHHKMRREMASSSSSSSGPRPDVTTELELGSYDDEIEGFDEADDY